MKRLLIAIIAVMTVASCSKKECGCGPPPVMPQADQTWTVARNTYAAEISFSDTTAQGHHILYFNQAGEGSHRANIYFEFIGNPRRLGSFRLVSRQQLDEDGEVSIRCGEPGGMFARGSLDIPNISLNLYEDSQFRLRLISRGIPVASGISVSPPEFGSDTTQLSFNLAAQ